MNNVQLNALNEAKKELWTAKEPLKTLRQKLNNHIALDDLDIADVLSTLDMAIQSIALAGARLRQLEQKEARS